MANITFNNRGNKIVRIQLTASTNPTVVCSGKVLIKHYLMYGPSSNSTFVKTYDQDTLPTNTDTPICTTRFFTNNNAAYPQVSAPLIRYLNLFCENGISIRTTANVEDNDNTAITITSGVRWLWIIYEEV